jgi:hypothetical protein
MLNIFRACAQRRGCGLRRGTLQRDCYLVERAADRHTSSITTTVDASTLRRCQGRRDCADAPRAPALAGWCGDQPPVERGTSTQRA